MEPREAHYNIADRPEPTWKPCYRAPVELSDQFRGCLLGLAVGDALGGPAVRLTRAQLRAQHGVLTDMVGGGRLQLQPGQGTQATEFMLCVLDSYNIRGAFDPHDVADRFVELLQT